ncbi:MAG TPA: methyltransferase domain-containing protein [Alphaproteobacteria bacterium]|nr:methyltransferase domain-containing protein [Alphaproteobacteria bacterium]
MAADLDQKAGTAPPASESWPVRTAKGTMATAASLLPAHWRITAKLEQMGNPRPHTVNFGDLRRLDPISRLYGWDRGTPVDRYYIEKFLAANQSAIHGHVLEISENTYTKKFGGDRVTNIDVLHYNDPNPPVTIVADLTDAPQIPSNTFDCAIITQTLMVIYDYNAVVETLHRALKPGGTVLATMAGLTQIADPDWRSTWHWGFTQSSAQRIFEDVFEGGQVKAESFGNVLSTISFLQGLAMEELTRAELEVNDPDYQMLIGVSAKKAVQPGSAVDE